MALIRISDFENATRNAARSALNKVITKARSRSIRAVRQVYNIKAADFRKYTRITRARNRSLVASMFVRGRKFGLYLFGARQVKAGVSVRIRKDSGRKTVRTAFIQTMPNGKVGVFQRKANWKHRRPGAPSDARDRLHGLPIKLLTTLDPAQMFEVEGERAIEQVVQEEMQKQLDSELKYYLSRLQSK